MNNNCCSTDSKCYRLWNGMVALSQWNCPCGSCCFLYLTRICAPIAINTKFRAGPRSQTKQRSKQNKTRNILKDFIFPCLLELSFCYKKYWCSTHGRKSLLTKQWISQQTILKAPIIHRNFITTIRMVALQLNSMRMGKVK